MHDFCTISSSQHGPNITGTCPTLLPVYQNQVLVVVQEEIAKFGVHVVGVRLEVGVTKGQIRLVAPFRFCFQ